MVLDKPTEYRGITISYEHWQIVKNKHLNLRTLVADAIDRERYLKTIQLDKECIEWIKSTDINFDIFVKNAIYNEMKNNGR